MHFDETPSRRIEHSATNLNDTASTTVHDKRVINAHLKTAQESRLTAFVAALNDLSDFL